MKNKYQKKSHISEVKFRQVLKCFSEDTPALAASVLVGINRKTTQRIYSLLRDRIVGMAIEEARPFVEDIEVDEKSCFGAKQICEKQGRGAGQNKPLLGLHKRQGRVFLSVVPNSYKVESMPVLSGRIVEWSDVYTDDLKAHESMVANGGMHHCVHQHESEVVCAKNQVKSIESFWSFAKSRMAKLRGLKKEKLLTHLKESEWRFNHRNDNIYLILLKHTRHFPL